MVLYIHNYLKHENPTSNQIHDVLLMVPLCQSKTQGLPFNGHAQVTGPSIAEHRTGPLGGKEVARGHLGLSGDINF